MNDLSVDYTSTARRPAWHALPDEVQQALEKVLGSPVTDVKVAGSGFTHGFAAVLTGSAGGRIFAKAASAADEFIYPAYVREAEVLALMPAGLATPTLIGTPVVTTEDGPWQVLCFEVIDGILPGTPWTVPDVAAIHDSLVEVQSGLCTIPARLTGGPMSEEFNDPHFSTLFGGLAATGNLPGYLKDLTADHLSDMQRLCARAPAALAGEAVLHNDLRADNILIRRSDSRAYICDWNFLGTGPAWADWIGLLPYVRHGGLDVEPWLAESPLTAGADGEDIDAWLAILAAYMVFHGSRPTLDSSPLLRAHGRFTARITIDWLAERRNWS